MVTTTDTKRSVVALIQRHQDEIRAFGVARIGLFGSFVRDEQHAESDVDLFVEFEPDAETFSNLANLYFFLEDLLGRRIEIVTPHSLSPYIGPYILDEVEYVSLTPRVSTSHFG